jgi:hypothetical protein
MKQAKVGQILAQAKKNQQTNLQSIKPKGSPTQKENYQTISNNYVKSFKSANRPSNLKTGLLANDLTLLSQGSPPQKNMQSVKGLAARFITNIAG